MTLSYHAHSHKSYSMCETRYNFISIETNWRKTKYCRMLCDDTTNYSPLTLISILKNDVILCSQLEMDMKLHSLNSTNSIGMDEVKRLYWFTYVDWQANATDL